MPAERRYVLVLCRRRKHIRVFRSDCEVRPEGKVLWEGDGLRATYDAMKALNEQRRPVVSYILCHRLTKKGADTFRVFKSVQSDGWEKVSLHVSWKAAVEAKATAALEFAGRREEDDRIMLSRLRKAGVVARTVPKLTDKDRRYLDWMDARAELFEDAA